MDALVLEGQYHQVQRRSGLRDDTTRLHRILIAMANKILNHVEVLPGCYADYQKLSQYHYQAESIKPTKMILKAVGSGKYRHILPDPIGVNVFKCPLPNLHSRNIATKNYYLNIKDESQRLRTINHDITYACRLIVDPRFWRLGIGTLLLKDGLDRQTCPIVETLTPIDFTNKMLQKAGFKLYMRRTPKWYAVMKNALLATGLTEQSFQCPSVVHYRLLHLRDKAQAQMEKSIHSFLSHFRSHDHLENSLERTTYLLYQLAYPKAYLIRFNPNLPDFFEKRGNPDNKVEKENNT